MIIDFNKIDEEVLPHFKGGEKEIHAHRFFDGLNRIMKARLEPGASIGYHPHTTSSEIIFITRGEGLVVYDEQEIPIVEGQAHYCRKGHVHSLINNSNAPLEFMAVVAEQ